MRRGPRIRVGGEIGLVSLAGGVLWGVGCAVWSGREVCGMEGVYIASLQ